MRQRKKLRSRRLSEYSAKPLSAPDIRVSDEDLDRIVSAVEIDINDQQREVLRDYLSNAFTLYLIFDNSLRQAPVPSEVKERLISIRSSAEALWRHLGITKPPEDAWKYPGILSSDISPALYPSLNRAVEHWAQLYDPESFAESEMPNDLPITKLLGPHNVYVGNRLRDALYVIASVVNWADLALKELPNSPPSKAKHVRGTARLGLAGVLSEIYQEIFGQKPTSTRDGPWLRFLKEALLVAGAGDISDEAARKLWQRAHAIRTESS